METTYEVNFSVLSEEVIFRSYVDYIFIGNTTLIKDACL